ncbi:hypothetical protein WKR88_15300 [Trinickia caryophylli]|uniref:Uncharacterized protein n=1 Tax=Trinickia caryophylli TaxID=28094 RepID=A0A1X7D5N0_TRICW|nr:hypothetical protein [Trinickia caryophylli]PMS12708.1 hypothetical protein C0Z17_07700 [Trinickia caryophylli]TRX15113.1 hypothetical protein FNF07_28370 [Trinickia caryophylli]WQE14974.1 hypothetical protein U0034_20695 [Trinickia caryophylli]SMF09311.1 hypothetical protein SAMN06295900_102423 [Trinickia caryophylli]GLU31297.1 hypothetical protein Busp01_11390 [Trinickia caryophylli]
MDDQRVASIAARIASYLERNRRAADTIDGIMHFWVGVDLTLGSRELTQAALERLRDEGRIARVAIGGRELWRAVPTNDPDGE